LEQGRRIPDLLVEFLGLRLMIEGEVDDQSDAEKRALDSALKRVEEGLAHIGVAVIYPSLLREVTFSQLKSTIEKSPLKIAVVTESGKAAYSIGNFEHLADILNKTFEQLVKEDIVKQAVAIIDAAVEKTAAVIRHCKGFPQIAAKILGIKALPPRKISARKEELDD